MFDKYIPNNSKEIRNQLKKTIGIGVEHFFCDLPKVTSSNANASKKSLSELEVRRKVEKILAKNRSVKEFSSFLGGGIWPHYVPAVVDAIVSRGEFLTSCTPY